MILKHVFRKVSLTEIIHFLQNSAKEFLCLKLDYNNPNVWMKIEFDRSWMRKLCASMAIYRWQQLGNVWQWHWCRRLWTTRRIPCMQRRIHWYVYIQLLFESFTHFIIYRKFQNYDFRFFSGEHTAAPPLRPIRPGTKPTKPARITDGTKLPPTDVETFEEPVYDTSSRYLSAIVIILSALLVVLCLLFAIYLYHYHGSRVKQFMHWNQQHQKSPPANTPASRPVSIVTPSYPPPAFDPPVPPPRAKRLSQTFNDMTSYEPSANGYTR